MATVMGGGSRIRTNTPADNAYYALMQSNTNIQESQLRLSTGKRINSAADDVAGYITSRSLKARNVSLKSALNAVGDAQNVSSITMDALDNIDNLLTKIKDAASSASAGALATDEKVALAKGAYRLVEQIQTVVDSSVFGGKDLLKGSYSGSWTIGFDSANTPLRLSFDMSTASTNVDYVNLNSKTTDAFAGISGLNLTDLNSVTSSSLGVFAESNISTTLTSISSALNSLAVFSSQVGGIHNRLTSQSDLLQSQITNFKAAISRIEDTDIAQEQLNLVKNQFLQQSSLISLSQANQNPSSFLQLLR